MFFINPLSHIFNSFSTSQNILSESLVLRLNIFFLCYRLSQVLRRESFLKRLSGIISLILSLYKISISSWRHQWRHFDIFPTGFQRNFIFFFLSLTSNFFIQRGKKLVLLRRIIFIIQTLSLLLRVLLKSSSRWRCWEMRKTLQLESEDI